jgi:hypothetical protein
MSTIAGSSEIKALECQLKLACKLKKNAETAFLNACKEIEKDESGFVSDGVLKSTKNMEMIVRFSSELYDAMKEVGDAEIDLDRAMSKLQVVNLVDIDSEEDDGDKKPAAKNKMGATSSQVGDTVATNNCLNAANVRITHEGAAATSTSVVAEVQNGPKLADATRAAAGETTTKASDEIKAATGLVELSTNKRNVQQTSAGGVAKKQKSDVDIAEVGSIKVEECGVSGANGDYELCARGIVNDTFSFYRYGSWNGKGAYFWIERTRDGCWVLKVRKTILYLSVKNADGKQGDPFDKEWTVKDGVLPLPKLCVLGMRKSGKRSCFRQSTYTDV